VSVRTVKRLSFKLNERQAATWAKIEAANSEDAARRGMYRRGYGASDVFDFLLRTWERDRGQTSIETGQTNQVKRGRP
jgi:hypothetical protein